MLAGVNFPQFEFSIFTDFKRSIFTQIFLSLWVKNLRLEVGEESKISLPRASSLSHTLSFFLLQSLLLFVSGSTFPRGDIDLLEAKQAPFCSHTTHTCAHTCAHPFVFPWLQRTLHQLTFKTNPNTNQSCNFPNPTLLQPQLGRRSRLHNKTEFPFWYLVLSPIARAGPQNMTVQTD